MNWMFESRSKSYDYDDSEGESGPPWYVGLLFPILIIPLGIVFAIFHILWFLLIIVHWFCEIIKETAKSGDLKFPGLTFMGLGVAIVLPLLIATDLFRVSEHPFMLLCATLYVLLFHRRTVYRAGLEFLQTEQG